MEVDVDSDDDNSKSEHDAQPTAEHSRYPCSDADITELARTNTWFPESVSSPSRSSAAALANRAPSGSNAASTKSASDGAARSATAAASAEPVICELTDYAFVPDVLRVAAGQKVIFKLGGSVAGAHNLQLIHNLAYHSAYVCHRIIYRSAPVCCSVVLDNGSVYSDLCAILTSTLINRNPSMLFGSHV